MKHKKISFLTVFMALLLLFQLLATSALADNNEPVTLKNVRLGTEIYNIAEDNTITINTEDKVTEIGLIFSHNVENQDYLEDNIDKVTLTEITAEGDLVVTIDVQGLSGAYDDPDFEGSQTGLLIVPEYDLTDGHYKIEVDRGVQANAGSTTKDYTIYLNVGEADTGEIDPDARKISFDVNAPNPSISVKDSKNKVYYSEDGTTFYLPDGDYKYTVAATGYVTVQGEFTVAGEDDVITIDDMRDEVEVTINVTLQTLPSC